MFGDCTNVTPNHDTTEVFRIEVRIKNDQSGRRKGVEALRFGIYDIVVE